MLASISALSARSYCVLAKKRRLEVILDEGRNRHIRRILDAMGFAVQRLMRIAIGPVALGALAKGEWRVLTAIETTQLTASKIR